MSMVFEASKRNFYCLYIQTGLEWNYVNEIQPKLDDPSFLCKGKLYCLGRKMRLKNGKEYIDTIFPGYVFWETESLEGFSFLQKGKGFLKILPSNASPHVLEDKDVELIRSFLNYGMIMPLVHVEFDVNDRIRILDGLFRGQEGLVKSVNRRNKRVNFEVQLMNGVHIIGLSYQEVKKLDDQ